MVAYLGWHLVTFFLSADFILWCPKLQIRKLQDSSAVLSHFKEDSEHCFSEVSGDFTRNTRLLRSMKSDLDYIFQKLRYA